MVKQTTIRTVPFDPKHLEVMEIRDLEKYGYFSAEDASERITALSQACISAATVLYDGRVLACMGVMLVTPGVADGWIIPSVYAERFPLAFCKTVKAYIEGLWEDFQLHRFQTTSFNDKLHVRWMKWLGLEKEAVLRQFTHKREDRVLYARIRQWD